MKDRIDTPDAELAELDTSLNVHDIIWLKAERVMGLIVAIHGDSAWVVTGFGSSPQTYPLVSLR